MMMQKSTLGSFSINHYGDVDPSTSTNALTRFAQTYITSFGIKHQMIWDKVEPAELFIVLCILQHRGAPAISADTLADPLASQEAVLDGPCSSDVDPYLPNHIILAPSSTQNTGLGAFAFHKISKGHFLGTYTGSPIYKELRAKQMQASNPYILSIYRDTASRRFVLAIDSSHLWDIRDSRGRLTGKQGSWHRFIQHSSDPAQVNVDFRIFTPDQRTNKRDYRIDVYATRDIARGKELFANYCTSKFIEASRCRNEPTW